MDGPRAAPKNRVETADAAEAAILAALPDRTEPLDQTPAASIAGDD
jgi:hypothetical protein